MNDLNKSDIAKMLVDQCPELDLETSEQILEIIFEEISSALICGDRVELRGLCSLIARQRKERIIKNPKTKRYINIEPRKVVYFRASKEFIKELNDYFK